MIGIRVEQQGLMTTIQDLGRVGHRAAGISQTGSLDTYAASIANWLVGNEEQSAVLEMTIIGPVLKFETEVMFSLCGANLQPVLNGEPIPNWTAVQAHVGDVLSFLGKVTGSRTYMAVSGGFQTPLVLGSRSTHVKAGMGGHEGRPLKKGDLLPVLSLNPEAKGWTGNRLDPSLQPQYESEVQIAMLPGPHLDRFVDGVLEVFCASPYKVTTLCDRMGFRLAGTPLTHKAAADLLSEPNQIGSIQVPGDGQPIILMNDAGTTGGYTKIATVLQSELHKIAQLGSGDVIQFVPLSIEEARTRSVTYFKSLESIKKELLAWQRPLGKAFTVKVNGKSYSVYVEEVKG